MQGLYTFVSGNGVCRAWFLRNVCWSFFMNDKVQHVFLVGAKSQGAYGGYETFVDKLTEYHLSNRRIKYHVACKANGDGYMDESKLRGVTDILRRKDGTVAEFTYHNARCFKLVVPNIGPAQAIYYDLAALWECCRYIELYQIPHPIIYIMACRVGPFMSYFCRKIHKLGGKIYLNPDGHEWLRAKWNRFIRKYWKISEQMMVCKSDLVICDSVNIEKYIHEQYDHKVKGKLETTYIAYGAETRKSHLADDSIKFTNWMQEKDLKSGEYYLVVGRFVPENNYETMIREFMKSKTRKNFAIITNINDKFLSQLEKKLHFSQDKRIKFVGTVYDQELLQKIRENAYGYLHGHEVGGTNPSLLEALGATKLNLLFDVGFNREVAENAALYWDKQDGCLAALIEWCDVLPDHIINSYAEAAQKRVQENYSWTHIAQQYEFLFTGTSVQ